MSPLPPERLPAIRVKLKCRDEAEFLTLLAPVIAKRGVFFSRPQLPVVGSRVKVELEFAGGVVGVSGEAVVLRHVPSGERSGVTLHLVRLDPGSAQFPLVPLPAALSPTDVAPPPSKNKPGLRSATKFDVDSLRLIEEPAPPAPQVTAAPAVVPPALMPIAPPAALVPAPVPVVAEVSASAIGGPKGRGLFAATALVAILAVGIAVSSVRRRQELSAAVAAHVTRADERIAAGRLAGPSGDEALDHLLAARALRADDPRVTERLAALAEKFEQLGDKALERGDAVEAAVHYQGAVLAEPSRTKASQRLKEIEARVRTGSAGNPSE